MNLNELVVGRYYSSKKPVVHFLVRYADSTGINALYYCPANTGNFNEQRITNGDWWGHATEITREKFIDHYIGQMPLPALPTPEINLPLIF